MFISMKNCTKIGLKLNKQKGVFEVVAKSREAARQKVIQYCRMVMSGNVHSTLTNEKVNLAFSIHSKVRTRQITIQEEQTEQRTPSEKHLVTFDSELRQLKSNKKPS